VQLYISRESTTSSDPLRELRGFQRVHLAPGASQVVQFHLDAASVPVRQPLHKLRISIGGGQPLEDVSHAETLFLTVLTIGENRAFFRSGAQLTAWSDTQLLLWFPPEQQPGVRDRRHFRVTAVALPSPFTTPCGLDCNCAEVLDGFILSSLSALTIYVG